MSFLYSQLWFKPPLPTTDFTNQTVIVTGSNVGLGLEAARHFARLNAARVILAVRNLPQGEDAKKSIEASTSRPGVVEVWKLDLSSFDSVKAFASRANKELKRLDVLMLNASIATAYYRLAESYESTITVNVLSTFLLLLLLLPLVQSTARLSPPPPLPPRIIVVTSSVHSWVTLPPSRFADGKILTTLSKEGADMSQRYSESKLLQVLVVRAITPLLSKSAPGVVLNMLNPGLCHSKLSRERTLRGYMVEFMKLLLARSTEVGSRTLVASAEVGSESHGMYMNDSVVKKDGEADGVGSWVRTEEGKEMEGRVWEEVKGVLEGAVRGATKVLN